MYQVDMYEKGERDYFMITGPSGPLVWVNIRLLFEFSCLTSLKISGRTPSYPSLALIPHIPWLEYSFCPTDLWLAVYLFRHPHMRHIPQSWSSQLRRSSPSSQQETTLHFYAEVVQRLLGYGNCSSGDFSVCTGMG